METLSDVPAEDWDTIQGSLGDTAALEKALVDAGVPHGDAAAVGRYVDQVPADERRSVVGLARKLTTSQGMSFLLEPRMEVNLRPIYLALNVPIALYSLEGRTDFNLGNIGLDMRFGGSWDLSAVALAVSGGVQFWVPSGTSDADAMGFMNLLYGPKFFHRYLTASPYLVLGLDVPFVTFQAGAELVPMVPVRDAAGAAPVLFGRYGLGVTVLPAFFLSVVGELNGIFPIHNAAAYDALYVAGGVQLKVWVMKLGLAAQFPLIEPAREDLGSIGGVDVGTLAKFSVMGRLMFCF
jgi:hypothetical protein